MPSNLQRTITLIIFFIMLTCLCCLAYGEQAVEEVVIYGVQPGPKLWRVSYGDNQIWILGMLSPLPQSLQWDSQSVEAILSESDLFIYPPSVSLKANPVKSLLHFRSLRGLKKLPDKKTLDQVVPTELYQRWSVLKQKYVGENDKIERFRPVFAAQVLFSIATQNSGLIPNQNIWKTLDNLLDRYDVPVAHTGINKKIKKMGKTLKKFKKSSIDDIECFEQTLARIETDLLKMKTRATAWAQGNVSQIKNIPYKNQNSSCTDAFLESSVARDFNLQNAREESMNNWVMAVTDTLRENQTSFTVLPIDSLLQKNGPLQMLKTKGFDIAGPNE